MFDVASRYLLFPLKRAVADVLLPHLEMVSPAELCHWLILADMYVTFLPFPLLHLTLMAAIIIVSLICMLGEGRDPSLPFY